jgi:hypothetical protein
LKFILHSNSSSQGRLQQFDTNELNLSKIFNLRDFIINASRIQFSVVPPNTTQCPYFTESSYWPSQSFLNKIINKDYLYKSQSKHFLSSSNNTIWVISFSNFKIYLYLPNTFQVTKLFIRQLVHLLFLSGVWDT